MKMPLLMSARLVLGLWTWTTLLPHFHAAGSYAESAPSQACEQRSGLNTDEDTFSMALASDDSDLEADISLLQVGSRGRQRPSSPRDVKHQTGRATQKDDARIVSESLTASAVESSPSESEGAWLLTGMAAAAFFLLVVSSVVLLARWSRPESLSAMEFSSHSWRKLIDNLSAHSTPASEAILLSGDAKQSEVPPRAGMPPGAAERPESTSPSIGPVICRKLLMGSEMHLLIPTAPIHQEEKWKVKVYGLTRIPVLTAFTSGCSGGDDGGHLISVSLCDLEDAPLASINLRDLELSDERGKPFGRLKRTSTCCHVLLEASGRQTMTFEACAAGQYFVAKSVPERHIMATVAQRGASGEHPAAHIDVKTNTGADSVLVLLCSLAVLFKDCAPEEADNQENEIDYDITKIEADWSLDGAIIRSPEAYLEHQEAVDVTAND